MLGRSRFSGSSLLYRGGRPAAWRQLRIEVGMQAIDDECLHGNVGLAETCHEDPTLVNSILTGCDDQYEGGRGFGEQFDHSFGSAADPGPHSLESP